MVRRGDSHTYITSKSFSVVFTIYQDGGVKGPHASQDLASLSISRGQLDENQIKEAFINGGRGHPPLHLKFFLLVFSKLKEDIK